MVPFSFSGHELRLVPDSEGRAGALYWPREQALLVADLHLEKASYFARTGQFLPPYDSRETLEKLATAIRKTGARRVFALGDNFHDNDGPSRLEPYAAGMLAALTCAVDWVWITGNHDPLIGGKAGGTCVDEIEVGGLAFRHKAESGTLLAEVSGHFHPKIAVEARGRRISRPCAVISEQRLILPAFGALTGGMAADDPAILSAMLPADAIDAILPAGGRLARFPLWRSAT